MTYLATLTLRDDSERNKKSHTITCILSVDIFRVYIFVTCLSQLFRIFRIFRHRRYFMMTTMSPGSHKAVHDFNNEWPAKWSHSIVRRRLPICGRHCRCRSVQIERQISAISAYFVMCLGHTLLWGIAYGGIPFTFASLHLIYTCVCVWVFTQTFTCVCVQIMAPETGSMTLKLH